MQDAVQLALHLDEPADVALHDRKAGVAVQMGHVGAGAGHVVVHPDHLVSVGQQTVHEMRTEKARRTGDDQPHVDPPRPMLTYSNPCACIRAGS